MAQGSNAKRFSIAGALVAALAASSCCIGPLLVALLGVGGAGAFATIGGYRPPVLGVTAVLLGAGFYLTYRTPVVAQADACGCTTPSANRAGKIALWLATAFIVLFAAAPPLLAQVAALGTPKTAATDRASAATAVLRVEGMDCQACTVHARRELAKLGGSPSMTLDVENQTLTVTYEPAPGRLEAYVRALKELGYGAEISSKTTVRTP
jgi:mercuric ion transport protein